MTNETLTQLRLRPPNTSGDLVWPEDVARLRDILNRAGYDADDYIISLAWSAFSESMCAGWMRLYEHDALNLEILRDYLEPVPSSGEKR